MELNPETQPPVEESQRGFSLRRIFASFAETDLVRRGISLEKQPEPELLLNLAGTQSQVEDSG